MAITHDVIVIGGGISGLTVAHRLKRMGRSPLLLDAVNPGGLVRSRLSDDFALELGANTLVLSKEMLEILTDLGLTDAIRHPAIEKYRQYIGFAGAIYEVPKSPPKFLASPLFTTAEKFAVLKGLGRRLRPSEIAADETVADFFTRILGPAPARKIIAPVLRGIFGGDVDALYASAVFPKLFHHLATGGTLFSYAQAQKVLRRKIFCLAGGNERLCHELRSQLGDAVRAETVVGLDQRGDLFTVRTHGGEERCAHTVVIATAGAASAPILRGLDPELAERAAALRYAPILVVHVSIPRESALLPEGFGVLFPKTPGSTLLGIMFNSVIFPHVAPPNRHLVTVCFGGVGNEDVLDLPDAALVACAEDELRSKLNVTDPRALSVQRWNKGIPQYDQRHRDLLRGYEHLAGRYPGLFFAGADVGGVGVPNRVERAFEVATKVIAALEARAPAALVANSGE